MREQRAERSIRAKVSAQQLRGFTAAAVMDSGDAAALRRLNYLRRGHERDVQVAAEHMMVVVCKQDELTCPHFYRVTALDS
jgi:hypothetical protein